MLWYSLLTRKHGSDLGGGWRSCCLTLGGVGALNTENSESRVEKYQVILCAPRGNGKKAWTGSVKLGST